MVESKFTPRADREYLPTALSFIAQGRLSDARILLEQFLEQEPRNEVGHFHLGNVLNMMQEPAKALQSYLNAYALAPALQGLCNNMGNTLLDLGRPDEALPYFEQAIKLHSESPDAHSNLGNALRDLKRPLDALACYRNALQRDPRHLHALNNLGGILLELHQPDAALTPLQQAIRLAPNFAPSYRNWGRCMLAMRRYTEALTAFEHSLKLHPGDALSWMFKGDALQEMELIPEAIQCHQTALKLQPKLDFLAGMVVHLKMQICDWSRLPEHLDLLKSGILAGSRVCSPMPVFALFDDGPLILRAAQIYANANCPAPLDAPLVRARNSRIRIAYYSADFHQHATSELMAELFESHNPDRFEVFAFSFGPITRDPMQIRVEQAFEHYIDARFMSNQRIAEHSRELGIDIAVDLKGHSKDARPGIFGYRCAPIQVNYLVYPSTIGMSSMDYVIADPVVLPFELASGWTEKIVHLPRCFQANDSQREISRQPTARSDWGLPEQGFVFCSFNNTYKILPETFDAWMRILLAVPGSVLWLYASNPWAVQNLKREAQTRGVMPNRLLFASHAALPVHLARLRLADLSLDNWPCNAGTTVSGALWAGLPMITYAGKSYASRMASSLLHHLGLSELVTDSPRAYEKLAVELAQDGPRLQSLRLKLNQQRASSSVFQGKSITQCLEHAFEIMLERLDAGLPPDHFTVPAL